MSNTTAALSMSPPNATFRAPAAASPSATPSPRGNLTMPAGGVGMRLQEPAWCSQPPSMEDIKTFAANLAKEIHSGEKTTGDFTIIKTQNINNPKKYDLTLKYKDQAIYTKAWQKDSSTGKFDYFHTFEASNFPDGACLTTNTYTSGASSISAGKGLLFVAVSLTAAILYAFPTVV